MQTPSPRPILPSQPRTHGLAVASLILGVLGLCCPVVFPIAGITCALIARSDIRQRPEQFQGDGLAIGGLCLSIFLLIAQIAAIFFLAAMGLNPDRVSALIETPPAEVFYENNLPRDGVEYLRMQGFVEPDEHILLYYDDSFMEKYAALSVLTDRRVLTVFDGESSWIGLPDVARVRYVPGSLFDDYVIHVHADDGRHLALIFTEGADVRGFAERITELVARAGGPQLDLE